MKKDGMYRFCGETRSTNTAMQKTFEKCGYKLDRIEENYFTNPVESAWKYVLQL
jgi:ribosomal protein S18 acetylase RimI-like enzyme